MKLRPREGELGFRQTAPFSVPKLAVNLGDFLEQFDDSFFEETSLGLSQTRSLSL